MSYSMDKLSGRTKQMLGKATGSKKLEMKGKAQVGIAQAKDKAEHMMHDL